MDNKIFKNDAKQIVDQLFDAKLFKEELNRDDFNAVEELLGYLLNSRFDSYKKISGLEKRMEELDNGK